MGFWDRFRKWRIQRKLYRGEFDLTPSGKYFLKYCEKIAKGEWTQNDYIEAYEEQLMNLVETQHKLKPENPVSRQMMAIILLAFLGSKG